MKEKKSWIEKLNQQKEPQVKRIEVAFADMPAGSTMFIPTPKIIESYIKKIGFGKKTSIKTLRQDLACENNAEHTCPVTTGIFLRIVAEAHYEKFAKGEPIEQIAPFWRMIEPDSNIAKKLSFGQDFVRQQILKEKQ
ncbi:MAG: hypothetical protein QM536_03155 [Chitinophagaceae bacterium]|nr:hypothetical protein [Chitinophagaceae bacterium]